MSTAIGQPVQLMTCRTSAMRGNVALPKAITISHDTKAMARMSQPLPTSSDLTGSECITITGF